MIFGLLPPQNITNLFGNWLSGINKNDVKQIRVRVCAIVWPLWNARNDHVFNKPKAFSFLQVIQWLYIGSVRGPIFNQWSSGMPWILSATV
jgi:hypothetical protein